MKISFTINTKPGFLSWILVMLTIVILPSLAQSQDQLKLNEAVKIALEKNHNIRVAENNAAIAENSVHPGNAGLLPQVNLDAGASYSKNDTKQDFAGGFPSNEIDGATSVNTNAALGFNYTLFNGLGNVYSYRRLKSQSAEANAFSRLSIEGTLMQVVNAYYEAVRLNEQFEISKEAIKISLERYERAKVEQEFGAGTSLNVLNARVDLNTDSTAYFNNMMNLLNAKRNLNILLGRDPSTEFSVQTDGDIHAFKEYAEQEVMQSAEEYNASILAAGYAVQSSQLDVKLANSGLFPRVSVNGSYGYNESKSDAGILLSNRSIGFSAGANLNFNLYNGSQRSIQKENAEIRLINSQEELELAKEQLKRDINNAFEIFTTNVNLVRLQRSSLVTAESNLERTSEMYKLGRVSSTQYREAQLNLIRVRNNLNNALYAVKIAEMEIIRLSGKMLNSEG